MKKLKIDTVQVVALLFFLCGIGLGDSHAQTLINGTIMGSLNYCANAGSTDAYACNLSPAITAYQTGAAYKFEANTTNTGAATINLNSVGAVTIIKVVGGINTDLANNDIRVRQIVDLVYDGTNMQMQSTLGNAVSSSTGGQCDTFVAPGTNVLQAAINALPATGGVICIDGSTGSYIQTGSEISIGDGSTSQISSRHGVIIRGVTFPSSDAIRSYATASRTVIDCTGTTNGSCFKINGPLEGWGLENLEIRGSTSGSESFGINVVSGQFGASKNLFISGFKRGINSTTHASFSPGNNYDAFQNNWEKLQIVVPSGGTHYGMVLGTASTGANTDFNNFKDTIIWPAASGTACMQMNWTDGIIFQNFICVANGDIFLDYTAGSGRVPNNNYWYGLEMGGAAVTNVGSPGVGDKLNYIFGFSETNASVCPNIAGTLVYGCSTGYVQDQVVKGLTASRPVISDSNKKLSSGTYSGNTTEVATVMGSKTTGQQLAFDGSGNVIASGTAIGAGSVTFHEPGLRLTTEANVPISTSDRTAQGTLRWTPFTSGAVVCYNGSALEAQVITSDKTLSLTVSSGSNYDVFYDCDGGVLALSSAWASDSTRTDAISRHSSCGCFTLTSDATKLWIGITRGSGSNTTEDSKAKRFVANVYHVRRRALAIAAGSSNHTYNSATWRSYNDDTTIRVGFLVAHTTLVDISPASLMGVARIAAGVNSTTTPQVQTYSPPWGSADVAPGYNFIQLIQSVDAGSATYDFGSLAGAMEQ